MHLLRRLLVVAALAAVVVADLYPLTPPGVEQLQIHNDRVLFVYLGNPGRSLRMRIRADTSRIYVFQHTSVYSQSWKALSATDEYGQPMIRETLVLGTSQFRADIVIGRFPDETAVTTEGTPADGVLGIGITSPLWTVWRTFTKSRDLLSLGEVFHAQAGADIVTISADLPPPWAYGTGLASAPVAEFIATLTEDSRHQLEHACHASLGLSIDDTPDFAAGDIVLQNVLGVSPGEQPCTVGSEYRVLIVPNSDYNVIPRVLLMHSLDHPPLFHVRSADPTSHNIFAVLFNRHDDTYVETDATTRAGSGVRRMANCARSGKNNTIVLGEYGLRRFDVGYDLDAARVYLSVKHSGLARNSETKTAEHSIEVRRFKDIVVLIAPLILWALVAVEPDAVYPKHGENSEREPYGHSSGEGVGPNTPTLPPSTSRTPYIAGAQPNVAPESFVIAIRTAEGARSSDTPPELPTSESESESRPRKSRPRQAALGHDEQLEQLSQETIVRVGAIIRVCFRMRSEWPLSLGTLFYVQTLVEIVVATCLVLSLGFYDSTWALTLVLDSDATSSALGWTSMTALLVVLVILSLIATLAAGRDARMGSLAMQCQVLIGIYVLLVSMYIWDLALALLFLVSAMITIVMIVCALSTAGVVPQYEQRLSTSRRPFRTAVLMLTIAWVAYSMFALFPFVVGRLWDSKSHALAVSIFLVAAVVVPLSVYLAFGPFLYPLIAANAACHRVYLAAQQRYCAITGSP